MILYSIIPKEIVFANQNNEQEFKRFEIDYLGQRVEVVLDSEGRYRISRIISTSLSAYLDPRLQPGMNIPLT